MPRKIYVTSDEDGSIWVIFGSDSGFGGKTTIIFLYLLNADVRQTFGTGS